MVLITGSVITRNSQIDSLATTKPANGPTITANRKSCPTSQNVTAAPRAATAVRNDTSAVASLSSDSPSRIVTTRRGNPALRATATAATASGGATMAPTANAAANGTGSSPMITSATPTAQNSTNPIDNHPIALRFALKSTSEVFTAAAYSSGGRKPNSAISAVSSGSGNHGSYDTTAPTRSSSRGAGMGSRRHSAVTSSTVLTQPTTSSRTSIKISRGPK